MVKKYPPIPALDGVRGLAVLFVLLCHTGYSHFAPLVVGMGTFGVMLFFVLSGFLMAYHYLPDGFSARYWSAFCAHRFVRVYPAFFLATFGYLLMQYYLPKNYPGIPRDGWQGLVPIWLLAKNRDLFWTIPAEIKFYLIYPLIAYGIFCLPSRKTLSALALLGAGLLYLITGNHSAGLSLSYLAFFISGVTSGHLFKKYDLERIKPAYWEALTFILLLGFCFILGAFHFSGLNQQQLFTLTWPGSPILALFLLSLGRSQGIAAWIFTNPVSRFMGRISYSAYLMHWFLIAAFKHLLPASPLKSPLSWCDSFLVFAWILLVSWIYHLLVESPCTRLAKNISKNILSSGHAPKNT